MQHVTPPSNKELERQVLGILLANPSLQNKFQGYLTTKDFLYTEHKAVWMTIELGIELEKEVDMVTFEDVFVRISSFDAEVFKDVGGYDYVIGLVSAVVSSAVIEQYVKNLKEFTHRRAMLELADEIKKSVGKSKDLEKISSSIYESLEQIQKPLHGKPRILVSGEFEKVRPEIMRERKQLVNSVLTSWNTVNEVLFQGFVSPNLSVIAARPKVGKSTLRQALTLYWCKCLGLGVYDFCPEQGRELEHDGLVSMLGKVPITYLQNPRVVPEGVNEEDLRSDIIEAERALDSYSLVIDGTRGRSFQSLVNEVKFAKLKFDIKIVTIDLMDYMREVQEEVRNKNAVIGRLLRKLHEVGQELDVHICNIWQIHRALSDTWRKTPSMEDFKNSGDVEEAANLLMLMWRPRRDNPDSPDDGVYLRICPQRGHGEGGTVKLLLTKDCQLIEYPEDELEEENSVPF